MEMFIKSVDINLWDIITDGDHIPSRENAQGIQELIPKAEWSVDDRTKIQSCAKAKYLLTCALSKSEYNKVMSCTTAKEIWDRLEVLHLWTNQLKQTKISMLVHQYELFKMEEHESIEDMESSKNPEKSTKGLET